MDVNHHQAIRSIGQRLKNWLMPLPTCELCQAQCHGSLPLCTGCQAQLPWIETGCRSCGEPLLSSCGESLLSYCREPIVSRTALQTPTELCERCQHLPLPFSHVVIPLRYGFPINQWIGALKYQERPGMANWLAQLLAEQVQRHYQPFRIDQAFSTDLATPHDQVRPTIVTGVPMHPPRQRQRGYNQSALLARTVARQLDLPFTANLLQKTRATRHQRTLNAAARRHNLQNAFELTSTLQDKVKGQHIALVDDVVTTGATSAEIANVLLQAGAASVCLWALAKTPMHYPNQKMR